jgi:hypothetical protein
MASSSFRRMTNTPNAEVLQVSAVRLGRTVSSMSFARKAATLPSCRCVVLSISHHGPELDNL